MTVWMERILCGTKIVAEGWTALSQIYVHGYGTAENIRLADQAKTLEELLHYDTAYVRGSRVLEVGCGVGAQTVPLIRNSPGADLTCVDVSATSLLATKTRITAAGLPCPTLKQADVYELPFENASFDHAFVCFVLEHLAQPHAALAELRRVLRAAGTLTIIEGDHGSTLFHPDDEAARKAIQCQIDLQRAAGGDALIGRKLYPLLIEAGLSSVRVCPRMVYVDTSKQHLVDGFIRRTFTPMVAGVREAALEAGLANAAEFDRGVHALLRAAEEDGVFCYTFFKAVGSR